MGFHFTEDKDTFRLNFGDALTIYSVEEVHGSLVKIPRDKAIELNFADVKEIDSAGIQLVLSYLKSLNNDNGFIVSDISEVATRNFELFGLKDYLLNSGLEK